MTLLIVAPVVLLLRVIVIFLPDVLVRARAFSDAETEKLEGVGGVGLVFRSYAAAVVQGRA